MEAGILRCCNSFCAAGCVGPRTDQCHVSAQFGVCVCICVCVCVSVFVHICVHVCVYMCVLCVSVCALCVCLCACKERKPCQGVFMGFLTLIDYNNIQTLCEVFYNTYLVFPKIIFPSLDS